MPSWRGDGLRGLLQRVFLRLGVGRAQIIGPGRRVVGINRGPEPGQPRNFGGRLVIDLPRMMHARPGSPLDVILRDGDELIVPRFQQQVTVIGEVQSATSHLYSPDLSRDDYIGLSGGVTQRANRGKIYIVHANGSVVAAQGHRWFQTTGSDLKMKPGDTIVVPLDTERLPPLPFWTAVTTIIYNVAIAVAAVRSF